MQEGGLDPWRGSVVGVAVETGCRFHRSFAFPDLIHAGLRVGHLGSSSVRYEIGLFRNEDDEASAEATSSMSSSTGRLSGRCPSDPIRTALESHRRSPA